MNNSLGKCAMALGLLYCVGHLIVLAQSPKGVAQIPFHPINPRC